MIEVSCNKEFDKALEIIKRDSKNRVIVGCCDKLVGPTGPRGPVSISVGNTTTIEPGNNASVTNVGTDDNLILDFAIPRGNDGNSVSILGRYDSYDDLLREHPTGNIGDGYLIDEDLYVWSDNEGKWNNVGRIKGPKGDMGLQGEMGPQGIQGPPGKDGIAKIKSAYLVTFNASVSEDGVKVNSKELLPIDRVELDIDDIVTVSENKIIKFNSIGYYKISFNIYGYVLPSVNPNEDFFAIGFGLIDTDNIYIGGSKFVYEGDVTELYCQGIIAVNDTNNEYGLVNLSPKELYLNSPDLKYIKSDSYFTNSLVTMVIEYYGK